MDKPSGSTEFKDAESLAAEALAEDELEWIVFDAASSSEPLNSWLEKFSPSQISSDDGVGWIAVRGHSWNDSQMSEVALLDELLEAWDTMKTSGRPINLKTISDLAKTYFVTSGKWLFFVETGAKVDSLWRLVAKGIVEGQLPARSAKVSPFNTQKNGKHVICVYNDDFTNQEEVNLMEGAIRKIGIKCPMVYKPDVYTYLGVYRRNKWHLCPSIYKSVYEITSKQSKIIKT